MVKEDIADKIADLAIKSMLYEVTTTPKPGLVDAANDGAHDDMDIYKFIDSTIVLRSYFYNISIIAYDHKGADLNELFNILREKGKKAEENMFKATNGINTQKGLIFLIGLVSSSTSYLLSKGLLVNRNNIIKISKEMIGNIIENDLIKDNKNNTWGERLYIENSIEGIRGEVYRGFPTIMDKGLPMLEESLNQGLSDRESYINTLLKIMRYAEDTNVISRTGIQGLKYMRDMIDHFFQLGGMKTDEGEKFLKYMDFKFIEKNISPGGSADLLATTIMFYQLEKEFK